jgi:hypothetical protein
MGGIPAIFTRIRHPPGVQDELRLIVEDRDNVEVQSERRETKWSRAQRGGSVEIRKAKT